MMDWSGYGSRIHEGVWKVKDTVAQRCPGDLYVSEIRGDKAYRQDARGVSQTRWIMKH